MDYKKSDKDWKKILTPEQYKVLREKGTEPAFTGKYVDHHDDGMYLCMACKTPLFDSGTKFESGSGWPSFYDVVEKGNVELRSDKSFGMTRTEVVCGECGGHLGHVFDDGPTDKTGKRYCINSCSLDFKKK
jgi:peptide-methionine (R)-S-oxide reductase